jgi:hypothetical protein
MFDKQSVLFEDPVLDTWNTLNLVLIVECSYTIFIYPNFSRNFRMRAIGLEIIQLRIRHIFCSLATL